MAAESFRIEPEMLPPFDGFGPDAFTFFEELAAHQDREWFTRHRRRYEEAARRPMVALLVALQEAFAGRRAPYKGDPVSSVFRINRDVRFSKDKSPYKTNIGAALTRSGDRADAEVFYIHLGAEACFAAAGVYNPPPDMLHAIRSAIAEDPADYLEIIGCLSGAGLTLDDADSLKRLPRGFDREYADEIARALKLKSFVVRRSFTRAEAASQALVAILADFAASAAPLRRLASSPR